MDAPLHLICLEHAIYSQVLALDAKTDLWKKQAASVKELNRCILLNYFFLKAQITFSLASLLVSRVFPLI